MAKKKIVAAVIAVLVIVALIVCFVLIRSDSWRGNPLDKDLGIEQDSPAEHGNGMEALPVPPEAENEEAQEPQKYTLTCRFDGMIDENSFEVTELNIDPETGEKVDGKVSAVRIGNDSVRADIDVAEIGESLTIVCYYNSYSQLIAERIMFLSLD